MTTTVVSGKLHTVENSRPTFGNAVWEWINYWFISNLLLHFGLSYFGLILSYFFLFSAIGTTLHILLVPKYTRRFIPDKKMSKNSLTDLESDKEESNNKSVQPPKVKINSPPSEESRPSFCPECGSEHEEYARFCTSCGKGLI